MGLRFGSRRRVARGVCIALPVVLVVLACSPRGTGDAPPNSDRDLIEQVLRTSPPDDPGPDVGGQALRDEVFADGVVTFEEYERAVNAAIRCIEEEGFLVEGPHRYPEGILVLEPGGDPRLRLSYVMPVDGDDPTDRLGAVSSRCQAQWSYHIEFVWVLKHAPTEEEVQAWLERAWACLADLGMALSEPPTLYEAMDSTAYGCRPWER